MTPAAGDTPELRVAVVGSGPAGFYSAGFLLARTDLDVRLDMLDRLPTPWGLVRAGVAPDHPNIKAVTRVYEKTAAHANFRFFGNVEVGTHVTRDELLERYHAVIYAFGARADRRMGIPGEDLAGSWPATDLVAWYNGHPDSRDLEFDLSCERAVVVGNGNVAADVARMLALTPEELRVTDTADHAIEALAASRIREIVVLGRRGPVQAAFTNPELRELGEMSDADVFVDPRDAELDAESAAVLEGDEVTVTARRNVEIITDYSRRTAAGKRRRIVLRFLTSPVEILGTERVEAIRVCRNELVRSEDGTLRARPTDEVETLPAGLVFRSIGYRGVPLPGLPFDDRRALVPNEEGRVIDPETRRQLPGEYVVGWIKRGPTGIIGTNKKDAQETVAALLADASAGGVGRPAGAAPLEALLAERGVGAVSYAGWQAIDREERARGEPLGRPRVKYASWTELLAAAGASGGDPAGADAPPSRGHAVVTRFLDELDVPYEVVTHPASSTPTEQADAAHVPLDRAARAVPLQDERGFRVAIIPGSRELDLEKAGAVLGTRLRHTSDEELRAALHTPDAEALPPLAPLLRAPEVMDRRLLEHEQILISGGDNRHGVLIDPNDLVEVIQPRIADICRD